MKSSTTLSDEASPDAEITPPVRKTKGGGGVRISETLYVQAGKHAQIARRSVQRQIEFWSELGRLFEKQLTCDDLHGLLDGSKVIDEIRLSSKQAPSMDTVLAELEGERAAGTLKAQVTAAEFIYDLADDGQTLRRISPDGSMVTVTLR